MKDIHILKENGIDVDYSLELLGDMEMYDETIEEFLSEIDERRLKLDSYKDNDMENYAILVHSIKSDSKYLGFTKLAEMAYDHELHSKEKNISYVQEHYQELCVEINRIVQVIKNYLNK